MEEWMTMASTSMSAQALHRGPHLILVERNKYAPGRIHALGHSSLSFTRNERLECRYHSVGLRPRAPAELENVAESPGW